VWAEVGRWLRLLFWMLVAVFLIWLVLTVGRP
jgi:hypothetical protein